MGDAAVSVLGKVARRWFEDAFGEPTPAQELAWPEIAGGGSVLVTAPTGSGKTLAAFLALLDRLSREPADHQGVRVLYVSPLRALVNDVHRNLEVPLAGMAEAAAGLGEPLPEITIATRTGDTSQRDRQRMLRHPPDVLCTTPESLFLLLTSPRGAATLASVETVIVDEVHSLAGNKRGAHLAVSLERLAWLTGRPLQRIGLSATVEPPERIAAWLSGSESSGPRPVAVLDAGGRKAMDLRVEITVDDLRELPGETIWPSVYEELLGLIREHRSTLVFVNNRRLSERIAARVNELAGEPLCSVHHGSVSSESRLEVERALKAGELPALVATSTLELGIDIGAIDLVVQIESPRTVTAGLQRVGRSGHLVGETAVGRIVPKFRPDLLDAAGVARGMLRREVEETHVPEGCLDVLAQHLASVACSGTWTASRMFEMTRGAYPFRDLERAQFDNVLQMLAGRYPAARFGELRPRVAWNRTTDEVTARPGTLRLVAQNAGTIPDRGYFAVIHAGTDARLGELEEEFVIESRIGDSFVLGSAIWRIQHIDRDRVIVHEAPGAMPAIPFWTGEITGRPYELGVRFGRFLREAGERLDDPDLVDWLREECALGDRAALNLRTYLLEQRESTGALPDDRTVVVEEFDDELGDRRVVLHSPFGRRVHHGWMLAARSRIRDAEGLDVEGVATDAGFMIRFPGRDSPAPLHLITDLPDADDLDELLLRELQIAPLFGTLFRENAARALLLPRRGPNRRTPLWLQRLRAGDLLQLVKRLGDFPILLETYREAWDDVLRVRDLRRVAAGLRRGDILIHRAATDVPSPFAAAFLFEFEGSLLYGGDQPRAEWRSQLLAVDRDLLSRVVRPESLRDLLDERALSGVERLLQRLDERSRPRDPEELADTLASLGDLTTDEIRERAGARWRELLDPLVADERAIRLEVGGQERWVAAEHAGEYRAMRSGDRDAARAVLRRHLAGRGPVTAMEAAARTGLPAEEAALLLTDLQAGGEVASGEYRPGGTTREWVDADNLRRIHRETLRVLRRDVEPVDPARFAGFLLARHGLSRPRPAGTAAAREVATLVAGVPVPAAALVPDVLAPRFRGGATSAVDDLLRGGSLLWQGLPGRRVAIFLREEATLLLRDPDPASTDEARAVEAALDRRGALFTAELAAEAGLTEPEALGAVFSLVWVGRATNDAAAGLEEPPARGRPPLYGRWSLLPEPSGDLAARAEAWARRLLAVYGLAARETAAAAEVPVAWALVRDALANLEARGEARRGYFIRGLSGVQYALPDVVERLRRGERPGAPVLVAAADPANPYGRLLPVPADRPVRLARVAGSWLVVAGGEPVLAVEGRGRRLVPLSLSRLADAVALLPALARRAPRGRLSVELWDGRPVVETEGAALLAEAGFSGGAKRMTYRAPAD